MRKHPGLLRLFTWLCLLLAGVFAFLKVTDPFDPVQKFSWGQPYSTLGFLCLFAAGLLAVFGWIFSESPKQNQVKTNECPASKEKP
jgi:hypothetical protein